MPQAKRDIPLGIKDEHVTSSDHIAYMWETPAEFAEGVGFLATGIRNGDYCVIFGHDDANEQVISALQQKGFDVEALRGDQRLITLGGSAQSDLMLSEIGATFQSAVDRGAKLIRLLGNIGWGHPDWPAEHEILAFEARVTAAARQFPCVVVCMYDVKVLSAGVMLHGAFETHPLTICGNVLRANPYHVPIDDFLGEP